MARAVVESITRGCYRLKVDGSTPHVVSAWQVHTSQPERVEAGTVGELRYIMHADGCCWQFEPKFLEQSDMTPIGEWLYSLRNPSYCWWCGDKFDDLPHKREVHHIHRRTSVAKDIRDDTSNLFLAGKSCHDGPLAVSTPEMQAQVLARKLVHDPENFSLERWGLLRDLSGLESNRVTMADIAEHLTVRGT